MRKVLIVLLTAIGVATGSADAALVQVVLAVDNVNSHPGGFGTDIGFTINDAFLYDPDSPTSPLPAQVDILAVGFHANLPEGVAAHLSYTFAPVTIAAGETFVVDVYGRSQSNTNVLDRDNDFDVELYSGGIFGTLVASISGNSVPNDAPNYVRVDFDSLLSGGEVIDSFRIVGNDSSDPGVANFFSLAEVAAASGIVVIPEPASSLLIAMGMLGMAISSRRRSQPEIKS